MSKSYVSIGFVIRNSVTGEMLAECPDGPSTYVRTMYEPSVSLTRGDALRRIGRLGAHLDDLWSWSCHEDQTPETVDRYRKEHGEWEQFLDFADVVELRVEVRE
jgi:hypothetical protein